MNFPCPHCGSDESFHNRSADDFKPIVPVELQSSFEEPPPPVTTPGSSTFQSTSQIPKSSESQVPSSPRISGQDVDYRFEKISSTKESERGVSDNISDSRLENIEKTISTIENEVRTVSSGLEDIQKSQKVIESILTNINKKLLQLQKE